jgi:uncharacterized OB-fold protein
MPMEVFDYQGPLDPAALLPPVYEHSRPHYDALGRGLLLLQHCEECGQARYPVAACCPYCGAADGDWRMHPGTGVLHSWIRYHKSYLREFEHVMPYVVAMIQLDGGGPRITGRWICCSEPKIGAAARLVVERFPSGPGAPAVLTQDCRHRFGPLSEEPASSCGHGGVRQDAVG